jgi:hypothetical protein
MRRQRSAKNVVRADTARGGGGGGGSYKYIAPQTPGARGGRLIATGGYKHRAAATVFRDASRGRASLVYWLHPSSPRCSHRRRGVWRAACRDCAEAAKRIVRTPLCGSRATIAGASVVVCPDRTRGGSRHRECTTQEVRRLPPKGSLLRPPRRESSKMVQWMR